MQFLVHYQQNPLRSEVKAIQSRVETRYPDLSSDKQRAVTELVVRASDNMVHIEGGSFTMGEIKVPCEPGSEQLCNTDYGRDNDFQHKVTLDNYALSKYETTIADFDLFRELQGKEPYNKEIREREGRQSMFEPNKPAWTKNWQEPLSRQCSLPLDPHLQDRATGFTVHIGAAQLTGVG